MIKRVIMTLLTLLSVIGAMTTFTACNTMAGAGQDIQKAGGAIEGEANEHR